MFKELKKKYTWRPIYGCPGRFILASGIVDATISDIVGDSVPVMESVFTGALDPVFYCFFEGGGLISYKKEEGYLHTLCDKDGMIRKMEMLKRKKD